ncbi:MAG: helix-turn-helix domain-containing protein [Spirochaetaceae bacterium]|nr:helix-turn-helix domain-containing protein [Spirochaetaceae bacterium]
MGRLAKKGEAIQPVSIQGRAIATTFWGKAWCENLEQYSDFANRLPRGRSYARNGSVCHLEIHPGEVRAKVMGSELYSVTISIAPLGAEAWKEIKSRCSGQIASLLDLLGGKLSEGVMKVVTDRAGGLFPKPKQIAMNCDCPDWADMCKHVAAVLYGVGARLDQSPELLFVLRGVDHQELVSSRIEDAVAHVVEGGSRRRLAADDLSGIFGVDIEDGSAAPAAAAAAPPASRDAGAFPESITGSWVRELREKSGLTKADFASRLGISAATIALWEKNPSVLKLQDRTKLALRKAWKDSGRAGKSTLPP